MSLKRYTRTKKLSNGSHYGTSRAASVIRALVKSGQLAVKQQVLRDGERLDVLAGKIYGDSRLWWVIAAASEVGWSLQLPPGTVLWVPTDLSKIAEVLG